MVSSVLDISPERWQVSPELELLLRVLALGGLGIVTGLALLGHRVIQTIGEDLIDLEPSSGFCAELATAATVLAASAVGLPVSTSHALVGAVFGVGWVKTGNIRNIRLDTVRNIALTWLVTLPAARRSPLSCFCCSPNSSPRAAKLEPPAPGSPKRDCQG
ncbi:MAG: inorganic phosphate transporter [Synechococcales cyanobacterium CRU_2_2]|nr:inorganic phosphate transporter [Synechococcales cyanobacterium CRU_2_2]